jgi:hypothetical protein
VRGYIFFNANPLEFGYIRIANARHAGEGQTRTFPSPFSLLSPVPEYQPNAQVPGGKNRKF